MQELVDILENKNDKDADVIVLGGDFNAGPAAYDPNTLGTNCVYQNIDY